MFADEEAARLWAAKIAVGCGWPQEVRRFLDREQPPAIERKLAGVPPARLCDMLL
jgi:hypothetical protein